MEDVGLETPQTEGVFFSKIEMNLFNLGRKYSNDFFRK